MKAKQILFISLLGVTLAGCNNNPNSKVGTSELQTVINSLKGTSHSAHVEYNIFVNQVDPDASDIFTKNISERTFYYSSTGERGYKINSKLYYGDLQKGTLDCKTREDGSEVISVYDNGEHLYFRDEESGVVIEEKLDIKNRVTTYIQSDYDYTYGTYIPVIFDTEFRNPFDYIQPRDLTKVNDTTYTLSLDKASFALECYGAVSGVAMAVTGCTLTTDENKQITNMNFTMGVEGGEGFTYTRHSSFDLNFYDFGEKSNLDHVVACTNDNPKLAEAFKCLNNVSSYKYSKDYYNDNGSISDHIVGYITQDAAFYHHDDDADDTEVYSRGDDYDYIAVKNSVNNKYYGYEYTYNEPTDSYEPKLIMLSVSAAYSIDSFSGLGPKFSQLSPAIFSLKEGTDNVYIIENNTLRKSIASYFDFQFLGVNSQVLETRTDNFELTLKDDGSMVIDTGYAYSEYGYIAKKRIVYKLNVSSFNNTAIPSYVTIPDTTGTEQF